jgi:hypothetical protein
MPAKAGIPLSLQHMLAKSGTPAFTGVTERMERLPLLQVRIHMAIEVRNVGQHPLTLPSPPVGERKFGQVNVGAHAAFDFGLTASV